MEILYNKPRSQSTGLDFVIMLDKTVGEAHFFPRSGSSLKLTFLPFSLPSIIVPSIFPTTPKSMSFLSIYINGRPSQTASCR